MPSRKPISNLPIHRNFQKLFDGAATLKFMVAIALVLLFYALTFNSPSTIGDRTNSPNRIDTSSTNLSHIVFGIVGSMKTWRDRRAYVESWWRPNVTRGYVFLDRAPSQEDFPWPATSPPFRVSENITKLEMYPKLANPLPARIARTLMETFSEGDRDVRWYVMADDDTILFIDNLVEVLAKYDHSKYHYIGTNSECFELNVDLSFDMAFGGAGFALSYPLAEAVSRMIDGCIERYPRLLTSDWILHNCLADIGIARTTNRGFHQIDLHGDISGLLSSHPRSPVLSLHHINEIDPFFPSLDRSASVNHLMEAAKVDPSRLLQQAICFLRETNWTFSTSWGYSVHVYESIQPRSQLTKPLETFYPYLPTFKAPFYMFNTRQGVMNDPCQAPHVFFLESIEIDVRGNQVVTTYLRGSPRNLPACGSHPADLLSTVRVVSPATIGKEAGVIECCDVVEPKDVNVVHVKFRACQKDEILR